MEKDSIPDDNAGLEEDSQQQNSADTTGENQSSNEDNTDFFGDEEDDSNSDDASSQSDQDDTDDTKDDSNDDSTVEPELKKWADSQNISLETETEIKLAKRLRDTQKAYHDKSAESKQKFNEASNESTKGDSTARIEAKIARMDFFEANPGARELEGAMFDIALKAREEGDTAGFAYYQTPKGWNTLYKIAKSEAADTAADSSFQKGQETERKNLAKKQQASKGSSAAHKSAPESTKMTDDKIAAMSLPEYQAYKAKHPEWNPFG